jgi:hypothetical protein
MLKSHTQGVAYLKVVGFNFLQLLYRCVCFLRYTILIAQC